MPPRVSVVVPARNEARYITRCVRSILDQELNGDLELLVVDGDSDDGTAELATAAGATVLPNPEGTIPAALNRALEAAKGDVLLRFDAHAEMPPGYVRACLLALEDEGAANVGGWREARGEGPWGCAIARALRSPLGVGNPRIWRHPRANEHRRDVETVPLGCFPTELLRRTGGWRTDFLANEDFELNARLRASGGRVVFDPAVWSVYRPRESLGGLASQYWNYGWWKAAVLLDRPASLRARQLAPALLLAALGTAAWPGNKGRPGRTALAAYGMLLVGVAVRERGGWRLASVVATMHLTWGSGLLAGLAARAVSRRSARSGP